jgi:hypothetical protein
VEAPHQAELLRARWHPLSRIKERCDLGINPCRENHRCPYSSAMETFSPDEATALELAKRIVLYLKAKYFEIVCAAFARRAGIWTALPPRGQHTRPYHVPSLRKSRAFISRSHRPTKETSFQTPREGLERLRAKRGARYARRDRELPEGRSVAAASLAIDIDEMLVAASASGFNVSQRSFGVLPLRSRSSHA